MRHGRAKAARKTLQYFKRVVGLKAPYHVLVDATVLVALHQQQILPIAERVDKVLQEFPQGGTQYYILESALQEITTLLPKLEESNHAKTVYFQQALEWARKECTVLTDDDSTMNQQQPPESSNDDEASSPAQSMVQFLKNAEQPYIVASQDEALLDKLRFMGKVPIVRLANGSVLLLEHPSKASQKYDTRTEVKKWKGPLGDKEKKLVEVVRQEQRQLKTAATAPPMPHEKRRVAKKAKGANPLSCKKKRAGDGPAESSAMKRRKRSKKEGESS
jgi:rRNA-processing protein FCF1